MLLVGLVCQALESSSYINLKIIGVVVTDQEIAEKIAELLKSKSKELETKRYTMLGVLLGMSRKILRWANSLNVKTELDKQMLEILGPKDERDGPKPKVSLLRENI